MEGLDSWRVRRLLKIPRDGIITMVLGVGTAAPGGIYHDQLRFPDDQFIIER